MSLWGSVLWDSSLFGQARLHVQLQGTWTGTNKEKQSCGGWCQDSKNLSWWCCEEKRLSDIQLIVIFPEHNSHDCKTEDSDHGNRIHQHTAAGLM